MHQTIRTLLLAAPLLSIVGLGLTSCSQESAQAAQEGLGLVIENPESERDYFFDFGDVPNGERVSHTYLLRNTDPRPVVIQDLTPACSCSVPSVSYVNEAGERIRGNRFETPVITLPAGALAEVEIEVDSNHVKVKNVDKLSAVVLRCDSVNTPFMRFEMHLVATEAYQVTPSHIDLGNIPVSSGKSGVSDIVTAIPGSYYRLLGVLESSEGIETRIVKKENTVEEFWQVQAVLSPPLERGPFRGEIKLSSTGPDGVGEGDPLVIPISGHVVDDVVVFPSILGFATLPDEAGFVAEGLLTALAPGHRVKIVDGLLQGELPEGLGFRYEAVKPDSEGRSQRWKIFVEYPGPIAGDLLTGRLQLTLEDPALPPVELSFVYRR